MIPDYKDCPICGSILVAKYGDEDEPIYTLQCPNGMELPIFVEIKIKSAYQEEMVNSHYELEYQNHKTFHQVVRIWPYCVDSYEDVSNIAVYDERVFLRHITETPYLDLPWNDKEKVINKLQTYILFS